MAAPRDTRGPGSDPAVLSESTRRRIAAGILAVGVLLAVMAITDKGFFSDPPTKEEQAGDAVEAFFTAGIEGDFDRFCDLMTPAARDMVRVGAARLIEDLDEQISCGDIVEELAGDRFAGLMVRIRSVSVSGNRARVETSLKRPDAPSEFRTLLLEQDAEGDWLISDQG